MMSDDLKKRYPHVYRLGIERRANGVFWKNAVTAKTDPKDKAFVVTEKGERLHRLEAEGMGVTIDSKANNVSVATLREIEADANARVQRQNAANRHAVNEETRQATAARQATVDAYADALLALPEAQGRERLVMKLVAFHNEKSMPVAQAARFLRGFRTDDARIQADVVSRKEQEHKLQRKVEIRVAALARNTSRDDVDGCVEHTNLAYALSLVGSGMSITAALAGVGISPHAFD